MERLRKIYCTVHEHWRQVTYDDAHMMSLEELLPISETFKPEKWCGHAWPLLTAGEKQNTNELKSKRLTTVGSNVCKLIFLKKLLSPNKKPLLRFWTHRKRKKVNLKNSKSAVFFYRASGRSTSNVKTKKIRVVLTQCKGCSSFRSAWCLWSLEVRNLTMWLELLIRSQHEVIEWTIISVMSIKHEIEIITNFNF